MVEALRLSERMGRYPPNPIRGLEILAQKAEKQGIDVIKLNIGAPDTQTPLIIRERGQMFLDRKSIPYGPSFGDMELREQRSIFYKSIGLNGVKPENILVTQGGSEAIRFAMFSVTNQGDNILVPDPSYPNYTAFAYENGISLKPIETNLDNGFHIKERDEDDQEVVERIGKLVDERTKAILWSSPGNPTGTVYTKEELSILAEVAYKKGLFLIADEVYRFLVFDNMANVKSGIERAPSMYDLNNNNLNRNVIGIDSNSKELGACGTRMGYLITHEDFIPDLINMASSRGSSNTIAMSMMTAINEVDESFFVENKNVFRNRRDAAYQLFGALGDIGVKVSPKPPEGAFYLVVDIGDGIVASEFCKWMITDYPKLSDSKSTVLMTPMSVGGSGFYIAKDKGVSEVRLAYVTSEEHLETSANILRDAIGIYRNEKL